MAKGFYISKTLAIVGIVLAAGAMATIIALSVVYSQEKAKNLEEIKPTKESDPQPSGGPGPSPSPSPSGAPGPSPSTPQQPTHPWNQVRLPDSLTPIEYNVLLWPRLEVNSDGLYIFTGNSTVTFQCKKAVNLILIHSKKLNFTKQNSFLASLSSPGVLPPPAIKETWLEESTEFLVVQLKHKLIAKKTYKLFTEFTGELADDLAGFYRSEYDEDGAKKVVATTQMQPTAARKAFPCFDEPAMKANFTITLIHEPKTIALSNMPEFSSHQQEMENKTWNITTFQETPKMSTYLLAFIVSEFDKEETQQGNVQIHIWARRKAIEEGQGAYALNVTGPILDHFEDYYRAPYPLPKSDQIALPDFSAGAMENWGLITYRETALLYDPKVSSASNKERVVMVIAHELAHQWFGNLVTLRWWNDLWLNEGFASYVQYLGADHVESTWNIKDLIVFDDVYRVMGVDALASSHPLSSKEEEVNTPEQISELFDAISYSKGASVLRMLSTFLTETVFKEGLRTYLEEFQYGNTIYSDLWEHLQKAVDNQTVVSLPKSVDEIMNRWILQMGFPVVTINTATGQASQKHFLLDPESVVTRPSQYNYTWYVPITWLKNGVSQSSFWLLNTTESNTDFKTGTSEWVLANINVTGYYRVNYDSENWKKLIRQLETDSSAIPVINRAQIIDDAFNLARAKYISTVTALSTTKFLYNEVEYMPWQATLNNLNYFKLMFDRSEVYGPMKNYIKKQVTPLFNYFKNLTSNWTNTPDGLTEQYNQINAISTACQFGLEECTQLASSMFKQWMGNQSNNPIEPNLRTTIFCNAIAAGGDKEWNFALEMFKNATLATEADKLRYALSCSKEPWILNRFLQYTLDPQIIRKQDATSTISNIAGNVMGQSLAWDFVRANWNYIFKEYGGPSFSFARLIQGVTKRFSSQFELQQLEQFKKDNADTGFGSGTRALEQAIETTKANIKWVADNKKAVHEWFQEAS
ncbi:aminopeptidase N [Latimeria chalumnae]|uniref:Aminopeptidase n=1 Tax=Latimeria chalumnae TaxID=7897 RepID=M3XKD7_LATCH|nr:PREDICTED: aminopeptidase N [Latimeria chalumnae]XP_014340393.1 PREDICTED: aminopeptidase N [Latimeria chalumnae]|eukprot:XP_005989844.1 PREDICTED: aminopeptidase N [Latimeria chalumnae]